MSKLLIMLLLGTALLVLQITCTTYLFFWYEAANSSYRKELDHLSQGKTTIWLLRGVLSSFFSLLLVVLLYPLGFWKRHRHPEPDLTCRFPPVILIHGLYHNAGAWVLYRYWLKCAGFKNIYTFDYNSWKSSFEDCREGLVHRVQEVKTLFPQQKVVLIGHSLGGILSRACSDSEACGKDIQAVVTLGSPHKGSKLAVLGLGPLAESLVYGGAFMEELERTAAPLQNIPRLALYSPVDNMVLPNHALETSCEGWVHRRVAPISHVAILYHRPTARLVLDNLRYLSQETAKT
jgi:pimeloyl-ACP methyl ester carboxylesterase